MPLHAGSVRDVKAQRRAAKAAAKAAALAFRLSTKLAKRAAASAHRRDARLARAAARDAEIVQAIKATLQACPAALVSKFDAFRKVGAALRAAAPWARAQGDRALAKEITWHLVQLGWLPPKTQRNAHARVQGMRLRVFHGIKLRDSPPPPSCDL